MKISGQQIDKIAEGYKTFQQLPPTEKIDTLSELATKLQNYLETGETTSGDPVDIADDDTSTSQFDDYNQRVQDSLDAMDDSNAEGESDLEGYPAQVDANGDGKLTDQEIALYYINGGAAPTPSQIEELMKANPNALYYIEGVYNKDINGDGQYSGPKPTGHGNYPMSGPPNPEIV